MPLSKETETKPIEMKEKVKGKPQENEKTSRNQIGKSTL